MPVKLRTVDVAMEIGKNLALQGNIKRGIRIRTNLPWRFPIRIWPSRITMDRHPLNRVFRRIMEVT